ERWCSVGAVHYAAQKKKKINPPPWGVVSQAPPFPPPPLNNSPSTSRIVALRGVEKNFAKGVRALDRFDLDVRAGEFVSLLGPSGCGKSTALRIIAGLSVPSAGAVEWPDGAGPIGFVFQEPALMPLADGTTNVRL